MDAVYASDLTDEQWRAVSRLIPPAKPGGRPRSVEMRKVVDGIFYLTRTGCAWRMLPHDYPPHDTVYYYFARFQQDGTWEKIHDLLRKRVRLQAGKMQNPSAATLDSQSVKTTEKKGSAAATTRARK